MTNSSLTPDMFETFVTIEREALGGLLGIAHGTVLLMELNPSLKGSFWALAPRDSELDDMIDSFLDDFGL